MAKTTFTADQNKTVTINGLTYSITVPTLPAGVHLFLNEVEISAGDTVALEENSTLAITVDSSETSEITVTYTGANSCTYDAQEIDSGEGLEITPGKHTLSFIGTVSIPPINVNGEGINSFSVNGTQFTPENLPYVFTPKGGITNNIFITGSETQPRDVTLTGTNIETVTVNGTPVTLPYKMTVNESTNVAVSGEIYQLDLQSVGGAIVKKDGVVLSNGSSTLHQIVDVDKDTYVSIDGTHTLTVTGTNLKTITINGINYPVSQLPVSITNNKMSVTMNIAGNEPSEVHISGTYIDTCTIDGQAIEVKENGSVDVELQTQESNHFVSIIGSQPREYGLTFNNNNATIIEMDGATVDNGSTKYISDSAYIEATPTAVPVHFETDDTVIIEINGKRYNSSDFTYNINSDTEVDINTSTCRITIDYGDNSYNLTVPQSIVTLVAPHRDGWLFDNWSSTNAGITGSKSVRCTVDLTGKTQANFVCHYQKLVTVDKPNTWN